MDSKLSIITKLPSISLNIMESLMRNRVFEMKTHSDSSSFQILISDTKHLTLTMSWNLTPPGLPSGFQMLIYELAKCEKMSAAEYMDRFLSPSEKWVVLFYNSKYKDKGYGVKLPWMKGNPIVPGKFYSKEEMKRVLCKEYLHRMRVDMWRKEISIPNLGVKWCERSGTPELCRNLG